MTLVIRKYQPQDKAALVELWRRVFRDDPPHNEPASMIEAKLSVDDLICVAEDAGRLVAACIAGYDGHRGWLYAVAVLPESRRGGTGSQLVAFAVDQLKQLGCIKVNLQIRAGNAQAVDFYRALGFEVEDRISMGRFVG